MDTDGEKVTRPKIESEEECWLPPPPVQGEALARFCANASEYEIEDVRQYVEFACRGDEQVTHVEKIKSEAVGEQTCVCWYVETTNEKYWVITNPTNLYQISHFPSLEFTLSFHIGLAVRLSSRPTVEESDRREAVLATVFRKWEQAAEALGDAEESEDLQGVGVRCRECLVSLSREFSKMELLDPGGERPKAADFIAWAKRAADTFAPGQSNERIRAYLKQVAESAWSLVSWLTHASGATFPDGSMAVEATFGVLKSFATVLKKHQMPAPDRCSRCGSLRTHSIYSEASDKYIPACLSCGWIDVPS